MMCLIVIVIIQIIGKILRAVLEKDEKTQKMDTSSPIIQD